jgi:carbon-monoxide dehydrogenase medium subunit
VKPAPFALLAPRSAAEAVALMGELGDEAKLLAGGQSLLPMTIMRLAQPAHLVDLNRVSDFVGLIPRPDGGYRFGPLVRHNDLEKLAAEPGVGGYLGRVAPTIAHLPVRIRGTMAGSLAHADPASEWCAALLAADAHVTVRSVTGERTLTVDELLQGSFTTALQPEEVLVEVTVPEIGTGCGLGFAEISRRPGDFALAVGAAFLCVRDDTVTAVRVVVGGVGGGVARCGDAENALVGAPASAESWLGASDVAAELAEALDDIHTSAVHRRQLVRVVVRRALEMAAGQAEGEQGVR